MTIERSLHQRIADEITLINAHAFTPLPHTYAHTQTQNLPQIAP